MTVQAPRVQGSVVRKEGHHSGPERKIAGMDLPFLRYGTQFDLDPLPWIGPLLVGLGFVHIEGRMGKTVSILYGVSMSQYR